MEGTEVEVDLDEGKKEAKGTKSTADVERVVQAPKQEELELEIEEEDKLNFNGIFDSSSDYDSSDND